MRAFLARLGHWLVQRYDPQPDAPQVLPAEAAPFMLVFREGGDVRRAIEALKNLPWLSEWEFVHNGECRGRYPE